MVSSLVTRQMNGLYRHADGTLKTKDPAVGELCLCPGGHHLRSPTATATLDVRYRVCNTIYIARNFHVLRGALAEPKAVSQTSV
jgi:hypothetical protein